MIPLLTAEEMQIIERNHIERRAVSSLELQEAAAKGTLALIPEGVAVDIVAGPGNNGGDAIALARLLKERWQVVRVWALTSEPHWKGDAQVQAHHWREMGGSLEFTQDPSREPSLKGSKWFVDGMFGLGVSRPLSGVAKAWADFWESRYRNFEILALDQPSGIQPDDPDSIGSRATKTACFGFPKLCHGLMPSKAACGEITVVPLPFQIANDERLLKGGIRPRHWLIDAPKLPHHSWDTHKKRKGCVTVRAGSMGMSGAAVMATLGALRVGAGLVTVLTDQEVRAEIASQVPEAMVKVWEGVVPDSTDVLLVGPGGVSEIPEWREKMVLDASALREGEGPRWMERPDTILTPHGGEFQRLFGGPALENQKDRLERIREAAIPNGTPLAGVLLLKGPQSLIAGGLDPSVSINSTGHWGLATGGTGDFLAGMVAGLFAQGLEALDAARSAAWLHGACADRLGLGPLLPRDLADELPRLLRELYRA